MESTRRALIMSVASMILCVAMLFSTSFAWFTDSVRSGTNNIQSGNLDVEMYYANGTEAPASATWKNARHEMIFDYDRWEPGYTDVKHIKIANEGALSFKYSMGFRADATGTDPLKLAKVIDVYAFDSATRITDASALDDAHKKGTLYDILTNPELDLSGNLMPKGSKDADGNDATCEHTLTVALKMQDVVEASYQGLSVGDGVTVVLTAAQYTYESDSFGNDYDKDATYPTDIVIPKAYRPADQTGVNEAASAAKDGDLILLPNADSNSPLDIPSVTNKKLTFKGAGIDKTYVNHNTAQGTPGANLTIKNVTLVGGTADYVGFQHTSSEVYSNCKFTQKSFFYANKVECRNCTFEQGAYDYCFWTYGSHDISFYGCIFNTVGKAAKVYHDDCTSDTHNVTFNNCTFKINGTAYSGADKPAIAVDGRGSVFNITINNCTSEGYKFNDNAMSSWYSTYMSGAPEDHKMLVGCEGSGISEIHVTIGDNKYN